MHIRNIHIRDFKRFSDLRIDGLPQAAKLVVLAGPNGGGKSSLFDAMIAWFATHGGPTTYEPTYHDKVGVTATIGWPEKVTIDFWEPVPEQPENRGKMLYVRSGYRNEADFTISGFQRVGSVLDSPKVKRLIDPDVSVSQNYQRLVSTTIEGLFGGGS